MKNHTVERVLNFPRNEMNFYRSTTFTIANLFKLIMNIILGIVKI